MKTHYVIFCCLFLYVLSSCSNDDDRYPQKEEIEIIQNLPIFGYTTTNNEDINEGWNLSVPVLINSATELRNFLNKYGVKENQDSLICEFDKYSMILIFTNTILEDFSIKNSLVLTRHSEKEKEIYNYFLTIYEKGNTKEIRNKHFYTGIIINKLADDSIINLIKSEKYE